MISRKYDAQFVDIPMKNIETDYDVKVRVKAVGICGTDIHIYEGEHQMSIGYDRIPGHEFCGVIEEVGSKVSNFMPGDRVIHEPIRYCGHCYACKSEEGNVCPEIKVTGCNCDGGMEEYYVAPESQWHKMPDYMTWEEGALIEPYTIAAQVCMRGEVGTGDKILIYGAGPIGLMIADIAKNIGAEVMISEISEGRLALARLFGFDHVIDSNKQKVFDEVRRYYGLEGPNVAFDCAGFTRASEEAIELLSPAGRFVPVAGSRFMLDGWHVLTKQLKIIGSRLQIQKFQPVIENFLTFREHANALITDVFNFNDAIEAFEYAAKRNPRTGKIVLRFD